MIESLTDGPLLWFLNRGSGIILLVVLSVSLALGMLSAGGRAGGRLPAFVPQNLHRNLSILALGLVTAHAVTAVVDTYVDIRWWQAFVPWGATYQPLWLGLGTVAFDVMVVVALSTAAKSRFSARTWHRIHLIGYLTWPVAFVHGAGIGTDAGEAWTQWLAGGCAAVVLAGLGVRLTRGRRMRHRASQPLVGATGRRGAI